MEYLRPLQRTGDASLLAYGHAERDGHIAFATAYLAGAPNVHSGGFAAPIRETRSWRAFLDIMLAHSPALCACLGDTCSLHMVIDSADDAELTRNLTRGVVVHRFAPDNTTLGNDRRFELIERVLVQQANWRCAFLIDLDVFVAALPPCGLLEANRTLAVGTDDLNGGNGGTRRWMQAKAVKLKYCSLEDSSIACDSSPWVQQYLARQVARQISFTCAMVGGPRALLLTTLAAANAQFRRHWDRHPNVRLLPGLDMLVWNELALALWKQGSIVTGYPYGPVNLMRTFYPWAHGVRGRRANDTGVRECHARPLLADAHGQRRWPLGAAARGVDARLRPATAAGMAGCDVATPRGGHARRGATAHCGALGRRGAAAEPEAAPDQDRRAPDGHFAGRDACRAAHDGRAAVCFGRGGLRLGPARAQHPAQGLVWRRVPVGAGSDLCDQRGGAAQARKDHLLARSRVADLHAVQERSGRRCSSTMSYSVVDDCLAQLPGFEVHQIDWQAAPPQPFVAATKSFRVAYKINTTLTKIHLVEILRLYSVNEHGGYWLDGDAFALSPRFLDHLSCPFVVSSDVVDMPNGEWAPATRLRFPANLTVPTPTQAVVRACGGILWPRRTARRAAPVGDDVGGKVLVLGQGDERLAVCLRDGRREAATPLRPLRVSTAMRTARRTFDTLPDFPLRAHAASEWGDEYVRSLVDRGVHALHLTWMAQRTKAGQARPMMRAILDHVVRAGAPLAPAHARCTALAYKLLDAQ